MSLIGLVLSPFLACNRSAELERKYPEDISLAKTYFDCLQRKDYSQVEKDLDPLVNDPDFRAAFDAMVGTIPTDNPLSVNPMRANRTCSDGVCDDGIILDYQYRDERLLFDLDLRRSGNRPSILGMHITVIPKSFIEANRFSLSHKGLAQYVILSLAFLFVGFSLYAFILCIRSKSGIGMWLWALVILIGVSRLGVNWTTGEIDFHFLSFQFLPVSAFKELYGPWTLFVSLPLGTIVYFATQRIDARGVAKHTQRSPTRSK